MPKHARQPKIILIASPHVEFNKPLLDIFREKKLPISFHTGFPQAIKEFVSVTNSREHPYVCLLVPENQHPHLLHYHLIRSDDAISAISANYSLYQAQELARGVLSMVETSNAVAA